MLGLYLHIPFCGSICSYCNFNRGLFDAALKSRYVDALAREIAGAGDGAPADAIFFGGGTPSLLEPDEVVRLIRVCRDSRPIAPDAEITLETNPETATPARLEGFRAAGVTRISFGVQSFDDGELVRLGRTHSSETARRAIRQARAAGFDNLSFDLMLWLPGQTLDSWLRTVDDAIALSPDHLSLYLLELYPNSPLKEAMARGGGAPRAVKDSPAEESDSGSAARLRAEGATARLAVALAEAAGRARGGGAPRAVKDSPAEESDSGSAAGRARGGGAPRATDKCWQQAAEDIAADMYLEALARLDAAGLAQYEISNVARPGRQSRHNVKYWQGGEWRGFGCGAHSTVSARRWKNIAATSEYIDRVERGESVAIDVQRLTDRERTEEALFTGLRLTEGIDGGNFARRFGVEPWSRYGPALEPFVADGLMWRRDRSFGLTRRGMLVANDILTTFV